MAQPQRVDHATLTAVVRYGLSVGVYDVVIINPAPGYDVGVLPGGLVVSYEPPPVIDNVIPDSFPVSLTNPQATVCQFSFQDAVPNTKLKRFSWWLPSDIPIQIIGANFDNATVTINCRNDPNTYSTTMVSQNSTVVVVIVPASTIGQDKFCVVTLTNENLAYAIYSGISTKSPSLNLVNFLTTTPQLVTPRRALAVTIAQATGAQRVLYAIGGDTEGANAYTPTTSNALTTSEVSIVDMFGDMGNWNIMQYQLPQPCTFTTAVTISRFVYLICGNNGVTSVADIYRAQVLDPLATPEIDLDVTFTYNTSNTGNAFSNGGTISWSVSAVFASTDPINPGGESLPGEPFVIQLPAVSQFGTFTVYLTWDTIPDAVGYRVYRFVNGSGGLLAQTVNTSFTDNGYPVNASVQPLIPGSLGAWYAIGQLTTPRAWASMIALPVPYASNIYFIIAAGGYNGNNILNTFEYATVTVFPSQVPKGRENQTLSTFTVGNTTLSTARAGLSVVALDSSTLSQLPPSVTYQLYFGPGRSGQNTFAQVIDSAPLPIDGDLQLLQTTTSGSGPGAISGYCMFPYKATYAEIGFAGGAATGTSTQGVAGILDSSNVYTFSSSWNAGWSATGLKLLACANQRPFVFIAGGTDGNAASTATASNFT